LIGALSAQISQIISSEKDIAFPVAIEKFYNSKTFDLLNDKETLLRFYMQRKNRMLGEGSL